jgi:Zn-finger nucleic acid-binding protein
MECPVCRVPLIVVERDEIEVDYCIACHGLWFDEGEIEILAEKSGVTIDLAFLDRQEPSASSERYLRCPRCRKKMSKIDLHRESDPLIIDACPARHGIWFDQGEVGSLIRAAAPVDGRGTDMITRFLGETFVAAEE